MKQSSIRVNQPDLQSKLDELAAVGEKAWRESQQKTTEVSAATLERAETAIKTIDKPDFKIQRGMDLQSRQLLEDLHLEQSELH